LGREKADLLALAKLVDEGALIPEIDRDYSLDHVADALRYLEQGHARGKIVVTVSRD